VIGDDFAAVLTAAQQGDEAAFARLWHDGQPALLRYLHVIAPDGAEDIASETWTQVVRGLTRFRGNEQNWRAWLFTTARRRVIDQTLPDLALADLPGLRSPDAADLALENLATRAAMGVIERLPPLQAEVIMLRVVAGLDTEAVGLLLGRSPGAIRIAAHRGLHRLASLLAEAGVTR